MRAFQQHLAAALKGPGVWLEQVAGREPMHPDVHRALVELFDETSAALQGVYPSEAAAAGVAGTVAGVLTSARFILAEPRSGPDPAARLAVDFRELATRTREFAADQRLPIPPQRTDSDHA